MRLPWHALGISQYAYIYIYVLIYTGFCLYILCFEEDACVYIYIHIYIYIYMYIYIYIYIIVGSLETSQDPDCRQDQYNGL